MEIWRAVVGFEGKYEVSDKGRVRGLVSGKNLTGQLINSGYLTVQLSIRKRVRKVALIHRLVAAAFCKNPAKKATVNHKDGDKLNNAASNLEWATHIENAQHAIRSGLTPATRLEGFRVKGVDPKGPTKVIEFPSMAAAERALSSTGKNSSAVHHCLIGKKKTAYGYAWIKTKCA